MLAHNVFSVLPCLLLGVVLLLATLSSGADISVNWFIPNSAALPSMNAEVGDVATFVWPGFHDVHVHPSGDCDETGRIIVGASTGAAYTFVEADVGELVFACDVSAHCEQGLILTFTVSAATTSAPTSSTPAPSTPAPSKSPSATSAPSVTPTQTPTSGVASIISQSSTSAAVALLVCTTAFAYAGLME